MHTVLPSPSAQSGVPYLRKEVEVHGSGSRHHQLCHHHHLQLIQSHACGTFSWPTSKSPFAPFLPDKVFPAS